MTRRHLMVMVALVAVLAACGDSSDTPTDAAPSPTGGGTTASETTSPAPSPTPTGQELSASIVIQDGEVQGGAVDVEVELGDVVRLEVTSDAADEIHVHGYDVFQDVGAGETVVVEFTADITGQFEIELEANHLKIADLVVRG